MKQLEGPEVAVIITNYNYGEFLEQSIKSVLGQTYKNINLTIIDDASTDNSADILKRYGGAATVIRHKKNTGIVHARNEALDLVTSPYLLFLDADDWLEEDYIRQLVTYAEAEKLDVVYCGMQYYTDGEKGMKWIPPQFSLERIKNENYIHSASLLRTRAIVGTRFDKELEKLTHEDWDFFLNLALKGLKFGRLDGVWLNYRFKPNSRNITNRDADEKFAYLYKYLYEKYNAEYPEEVGYMAYYRFVKSFLSINEKLSQVEAHLINSQNDTTNLLNEINKIKGSRSYKLGRSLTLPLRLYRKVVRKFSTIRLSRRLLSDVKNSKAYRDVSDTRYLLRNKNASREQYFIDRDGQFKRASRHAIVLHLYYADNWDMFFKNRFKRLMDKLDVDLYVTMPKSNRDMVEVIRKDFPDANVFFVPNKGRDVLPFIKAASVLDSMGYEKILKVHSKKSMHRDIEGNSAEGGNDWLVKTLDALIPKNTNLLEELVGKVNDKNTGMIGASEYYYPLKMYLNHNRLIVERLIASINPKFFLGDTAQTLDKYGYFGGTMFWVDIKQIRDVLGVSSGNFQEEAGQTDGTTAHALERVLCILPQINNSEVYVVGRRSMSKAALGKASYPDWYYDDISGGKPPISIIVPVYSDWSSLSKNVRSLKKYVGNSEDISVHYVNDCGPEVDMLEAKIKSEIEGLSNFYYYRNDENMGFVKTCNRAAFRLVNQKDDILLLNSDTKVTRNFVHEMRGVLYSADDIGAVTSRSNNATIWSVPMTSKFAHHRWSSYVLYRAIKHKLPSYYVTPTIHGFCVLIKRNVLDLYGLFDEVYGKGYGEENDFAMRLRKHGVRCAVANYSYVFHYESRSFGNEARNRQIEMNEKILIERYPNYRALVQEYWDGIKEPLK